MTQVSKIPLRKEIEKRMFDIFLDSIATVRTKRQAENFLSDWLSPTERIMLAKRLSVALLLTKQYDQRSIAKLLRVGLETVNKVNKVLNHGSGGYGMIVGTFLREEKSNVFWEKIDDALANLFPPRHRDWGMWRKERWEQKLQNNKPY